MRVKQGGDLLFYSREVGVSAPYPIQKMRRPSSASTRSSIEMPLISLRRT